jgi:type II secretory pathway pseudopilin PulG
MRKGFSLVELVVALVMMEVGVLGVVGTLTLAARTMAEAEELERAVVDVDRVSDSLAAAGVSGSGARATLWGRLRWSVGHDRMVLTAAPRRGGEFVVERPLGGAGTAIP